MGVLEQMPPELIEFLTWLVLWFAAGFMILVISIFLGRMFGEFWDVTFGSIR